MNSSSDPSKYSKRYSLEELEGPIIALLEGNSHGLNINQISNQLEISRNTVSKWLNTLEVKNKIISRKMGVSTLYYKAEDNSGIYPGPYVLIVEYVNNSFKIKRSNIMYLKRINEINESLIGANLFKFNPFNDYEEEFTEFLIRGINSLNDENATFSDRINLNNATTNKVESYSFIISKFADKENQFSIEFHDLSLIKLSEEQLLSPSAVSTILNLFEEYFLSIQTEDFKIIMANKKVLDMFNNGQELTSEAVYCYDLFRNRNSPCTDCVGRRSLESGKKEFDTYKINNNQFLFEANRIENKDSELKGYILKMKILNKN
jgi:DNA-binding Lrp family transcriptional regulator